MSLDTSSETLRVGILLGSLDPPAWQARVIEDLAEVSGVRLCVVGLTGRDVDHTALAGSAWRRFVQFTIRRSRAMQRTDLWFLVDEVPVVTCRRTPSTLTGSTDGASSVDDCAEVLTYDPDVIINLAGTPLGDDLVSQPRLGVWTFRHGDVRGGEPPCLREVVTGQAVTRVTLDRSMPHSAQLVPIAEAVFPTVPHSFGRNMDQALLGSTRLAARTCRETLAGGNGEPSLLEPDRPTGGDGPAGLGTFSAFIAKTTLRWVQRQLSGLTAADHWHVGIVDRPIETLLHSPDLTDVQWFDRPRGSDRYVADPFGAPTDDGMAVLVEDYDHRSRHGRIAGYLLNDVNRPNGRIQSAGPMEVASFATHASYPYLFEVDGDWWCVPETLAAGQVSAFRFDADRMRLEPLGVLLDDVALADPTVFHWNGRWWLLGTDAGWGANTHLRAWWAADPLGPWTQHALDPLVVDVRSARGAGTPFTYDGQLYRPAQDCSLSYGGSISIMRVVTLDPIAFDQAAAIEVHADPRGEYPDGAHTVSRIGDRFLVDGTRHGFETAAFRHELLTRLRRLSGGPWRQQIP